MRPEGRKYRVSCVKEVAFNSLRLRRLFAYLREREDVLQRDVAALPADCLERQMAHCRLHEVQSTLMWFVTNINRFHEGED